MGFFDKIFYAAVFGLFVMFLVAMFKLVSIATEVAPAGSRTSAMSPCQCMVSGGCSITWTPKAGYLYSDGTSQVYYDDYGFYVGSKDVPSQCRRS